MLVGGGTGAGQTLEFFGPENSQRLPHRGGAVIAVPACQDLNGLLKVCLLVNRFTTSGLPGVQQRWNQVVEGGEVGVVGGGNQRVEGEHSLVTQHPVGVDTPVILGIGGHVGGVLFGVGAARTRHREGRGVAILNPARGRVAHLHNIFYGMQTLPVGGGIAAIHGLLPVEVGVAAGHEIAVPVGDGAVFIRKNGVVRRVAVQPHHLFVAGVVRCFRAQIRLREGVQRCVHHVDGNPLTIFFARDGAVLREVHREIFVGHTLARLIRQPHGPHPHGPLLSAVFVDIPIAFFLDGFQVFVHRIGVAGRVHPAALFVKALINKELPPRHGPICVQPRPAHHVYLRPEIERRVRINQQQRMASRAFVWRNGKPVRAD